MCVRVSPPAHAREEGGEEEGGEEQLVFQADIFFQDRKRKGEIRGRIFPSFPEDGGASGLVPIKDTSRRDINSI